MKTLRITLAGLTLALTVSVISATTASAEPNPDAQPANFVLVVDLPVGTIELANDFGWG